MRERPIIFSGPMVRAILDGLKSQTRRIIKLEEFQESTTPGYDYAFRKRGCWQDVRLKDMLAPPRGNYPFRCPYGVVGNHLWVRESYCYEMVEGRYVYNEYGNPHTFYRADGIDIASVDEDGFQKWRKDGMEASPWIPSIHMPRWASRITLEITDIRPQRLQEISEEDAKAEGIDYDPSAPAALSHRTSFAHLWDSINSKRSPWNENPWVWVIDFKRII